MTHCMFPMYFYDKQLVLSCAKKCAIPKPNGIHHNGLN